MRMIGIFLLHSLTATLRFSIFCSRALNFDFVRGLGDGSRRLQTSISYRSECQGSDRGPSWTARVRSRRSFSPFYLNLVSTLGTAMPCNNFQLQRCASYPFFLHPAPHIRIISIMQLWAVMLVNSSELFVHQCTESKVLDTLQDVFTSQHTPLFVRENLRVVIDAAARASHGTSYECQSRIRMLWKTIKPVVKLDEVGLSPAFAAGHFNIFFLVCAFRYRRFHGQSPFTLAKHCRQSHSFSSADAPTITSRSIFCAAKYRKYAIPV